jgi:Arc/MetJ family transcription regulator
LFEVKVMRTNVDIDEVLLAEAMKATGLSTEQATIEEGLRLLLRIRKQAAALANLEGLGWERRLGRYALRSTSRAVVIALSASSISWGSTA